MKEKMIGSCVVHTMSEAALVVVSVLATVFPSKVFGGMTYYYVGASNVWNSAEAYSLTPGGAGGAGKPGAEDTIVLSKDQVVYLDDSTISFLNGVKEVNVVGDNATAYIHLGNDFGLDCWFGDLDNVGCTKAFIVKTGAGRLTFAKRGTTEHVRGTTDCDNYNIGLDIREGSVQMEPVYDASFRHNYKDVIISEGATLFGVTNGITLVWSLAGAGTVTNLCPNVTTTLPELRIGRGTAEPTVFSGFLSGYGLFRPAGHTHMTGIGNTVGSSLFEPFNYDGTGTGGVTGFMTWAGDKDQPSSLGYGDLDGRTDAFRLLYLGETGETIARSITLWNTSKAGSVLDAGAHGGLVFTGAFGPRSSVYKQQRLVLEGSNTVACVLSNAFTRIAENGTNCSLYVTKKGTGTWRFADSESRKLTGVVAVEQGVLEFDSIYEAGNMSALGYATDLYEDKCDYPDKLERVPYAYVLGGDGTAGTFRYVGTNSQSVTTRPLALAGDGRIEAPNCEVLKWCGVSGVGSGTNSLAIYCAEGQTNHFANITNGTGVVGVAKEGPGDLVLSGELSFGGDLSVSGGGTLTVRDISGKPFRYYKLTLKETVGTSTNEMYSEYVTYYDDNSAARKQSRSVALNEFGLYSESGKRLNAFASASATHATNYSNVMSPSVAQLEPSRIAAESEGLVAYDGRTLSGEWLSFHPWRLLDNSNKSGTFFSMRWSDMTKAPRYDDPTTWLSVVLRLPDSADAAQMYDLNLYAYPGVAEFIRTPTAFAVSGSADGLNYEELASTNNIEYSSSTFTTYYTWLSSGSASTSTKPEDATHAKLPLSATSVQTAYNVLNNVRSVSVAAGSTLKFEGFTAPVISGLTVSASGFGTIDGFAFAESGTLEVTSVVTGTIFIPGVFANATSLSNVSGWGVSVNGRLRRGWKLAAGNNGITLVAPGFVVIVK